MKMLRCLLGSAVLGAAVVPTLSSCSSTQGLAQSAVTTAHTAPASIAATTGRTLQSVGRLFR